MNIAELSMSVSQMSLQTDIGVALLSNAMDTTEVLGQGMVEMLDAAAMERSVAPHIGGTIDIMI